MEACASQAGNRHQRPRLVKSDMGKVFKLLVSTMRAIRMKQAIGIKWKLTLITAELVFLPAYVPIQRRLLKVLVPLVYQQCSAPTAFSLQSHATRLPIGKAFQLLPAKVKESNFSVPLFASAFDILFYFFSQNLSIANSMPPSAAVPADTPCSCNYCSCLSCSGHSGHWQSPAKRGLILPFFLQRSRRLATATVAGQQFFIILGGSLCSLCKRST
jgi:hypothetical protein